MLLANSKEFEMSDIHFMYWEGNDFNSDNGCFDKKILVLGESHHGKDLGQTMTQDIMYDHAYSNIPIKAYTTFERALVGHSTNKDERRIIWNSVAFYNYVQSCVPTPRESPRKGQFDESEAAFFEVLKELKPDIILVWGRRLWEALPYTNFKASKDCEYKGFRYRCGTYMTDSGLIIPCYEMEHPSSGFSWSWWHKYLIHNGIL